MHPGNKCNCLRNIGLNRQSPVIRQSGQDRKTGVSLLLFLAVFFLILPAPAFCDNTAGLPDAVDLLNTARKGGEYRQLQEEELAAIEVFFGRMLEGERSRELFNTWEKLGFSVRKAQLGGKEVFVLLEKPDKKYGRGFYVFPLRASGSTVLMMPHGFYDLHTRLIGQQFFGEGEFLAAAWNTVHRNKYPGQNNKTAFDDNPWMWDMADLPNTCFTALTRAFARVQPKGHLVQLHGFAKAKRKSGTARDSDLILSNGTESPPEGLLAFGDCLKINLPVMVRLYPLETKDLGSTENISARILNALGHDGFVQMEMSLGLRERQRSSVGFRKAVLDCMNSTWQ
ncbi:MAG TPA: hypothetical protein EYG88_01750 [Desulfocapsa sulfexigens]|nr:hypothetical protein [Desulfocapsa sulfexigens]